MQTVSICYHWCHIHPIKKRCHILDYISNFTLNSKRVMHCTPLLKEKCKRIRANWQLELGNTGVACIIVFFFFGYKKILVGPRLSPTRDRERRPPLYWLEWALSQVLQFFLRLSWYPAHSLTSGKSDIPHLERRWQESSSRQRCQRDLSHDPWPLNPTPSGMYYCILLIVYYSNSEETSK